MDNNLSTWRVLEDSALVGTEIPSTYTYYLFWRKKNHICTLLFCFTTVMHDILMLHAAWLLSLTFTTITVIRATLPFVCVLFYCTTTSSWSRFGSRFSFFSPRPFVTRAHQVPSTLSKRSVYVKSSCSRLASPNTFHPRGLFCIFKKRMLVYEYQRSIKKKNHCGVKCFLHHCWRTHIGWPDLFFGCKMFVPGTASSLAAV